MITIVKRYIEKEIGNPNQEFFSFQAAYILFIVYFVHSLYPIYPYQNSISIIQNNKVMSIHISQNDYLLFLLSL